MGTKVTLQDFKDMVEALQERNKFWDNKMCIVFRPDEYDALIKERGANCGYNENKVIALRGYPKFDI